MKKPNFRKIKLKTVNINEIDDRMLLINLYATQGLTLFLGIVISIFQPTPVWRMFPVEIPQMLYWGIGLAIAVVLLDLVVSFLAPEHVADDGGVNERIFAARPLWHIAVICLVVAFCEEILFRGVVQQAFGPYWTSILFAAIHVRYLQHWLMTGLVFTISYAIGWVYIQSGTLWAPVIAHFLIDFIAGCMLKYKKKTLP